MRELSREEELERQIYLLDKAVDDEKWKRTKKTFFVLSAVIYFIALMSDRMECLQDFLGWIITAPILAGVVMFISVCVTMYMNIGAIQGVERIAKLQGELKAIKFGKIETTEIGRKLNEYKELVHGLKRMGDIAETITDIYRDLEHQEDYENEDEYNESLKCQLEDIKDWLKLLEMEYKLCRVKEICEEDAKWNKE
mgnify:CR=1 FL=1